jgi:hypothetical protein
MIKFDRLLFTVLFGIAIPLFCFIISWWGTFIITGDQKTIIIASLSGLGIGIIISLLIKLTRKPDIYKLPIPVLIMVYLFYNVLLFGMFMGIPFFHLFLGIIAGYYRAKYMILHMEPKDYDKEIRRIRVFCSVIIGLVCISSASLALLSKSTASEVKHMFHLPFEISRSLLMVFVITGGFLMIVIQYLLVKVTMKNTLSDN